ncbi:Uncharacterized protein FWK35_00021198 [Aphis craccivora]|uniref:Uncharacterized protein n=1 Tax=Aphis craccivora TaxID=307492 RepID=A0A6G0Y4C1_APHCR|nr:Uncharacterized protein FWK35_00021198 [Aphis craccivora]
MNTSIVVSKSVFDIRPFSKKSVTVGLLVNKQISIIILLECKLTKKVVTLDLDQWFGTVQISTYCGGVAG